MPGSSKFACALALAAMLLPGHAPAREVDDSYTIGQRFAQYRDKFPGIAWPAVTWKAGQSVLFDRPYKNTGTRDLHIDVFRPSAGANRQGILLVHGGGWRAGAKTHFYALANLLAQRGYTVFLPEFRLSVEAAYPAGMIDIGDALAWTRAHAAEFDVDPSRIAVGGASSGGQMASLLAYAGPSGLFGSGTERTAAALIDLDGVLDFTTPQALQFENAAGEASPAARWLGGSYEHAAARWKEASAASHVGAQSPPTLIVSSGIPRFTEGKTAVLATLERHGIAHRFFAFQNAPHDFWLFEPWLPRVAEQIDGFLKTLEPARGSAPE
ncbi:alpha/beta hydrolase [Novosphingobium sp. fls2-241-R2A-195]|uniref:alpha/beta hydrolase n=1 Tax=Novosphingobium sp. fls2-241-R2A-195 TaxID=3040296 RepID=UPI00254A1DE3|nr:alpha/beta hydrolase [Novosphingobium sp. fls2-241-R2A-195]